MRDATGELDLAARVARLTAGQRACLELVDDHATSKEIALRLGISRHTVDARLRNAMQTLGVLSRREAAVIWRAASGMEAYQPFAYQPSQIENSAGDAATPEPETEFGDDAQQAQSGSGKGGSGFSPQRSTPGGLRMPAAVPGIDRSAMAPLEVADTMPMEWSMAAYQPPMQAPYPQAHYPAVRLWGGANDLTPVQRLIGILVVALLGMLAFGLLLSGIEALSTLRA